MMQASLLQAVFLLQDSISSALNIYDTCRSDLEVLGPSSHIMFLSYGEVFCFYVFVISPTSFQIKQIRHNWMFLKSFETN